MYLSLAFNLNVLLQEVVLRKEMTLNRELAAILTCCTDFRQAMIAGFVFFFVFKWIH